MTQNSIVMPLAISAFIGFVPATGQAQIACDPLVAAFNAAASGTDFQALVAAAGQVVDSTTCPAVIRATVGRRAALAHIREANRIADLPDNTAKKLQLLETGMRFSHPWQLMAMIGDLRKQVTTSTGMIDFKGASLAYQAALADIADKQSVPNPPPHAEIQRLVRLAQQDRLAAGEFVRGDVLTTREIRGVAIESVPVPIQFVRDRDEMTELGRQYADDTFRLLSEQNQPPIQLVGHTDPDGSDSYNMELSLRRAQATKRYLVGRGYSAAAIEVEGRGLREPLRIEDQKQYTQAQIYQILRRVEVKFR